GPGSRRGARVGGAPESCLDASHRGSPGSVARMNAIERAFREQHGRVIAVLARRFGDLDLAEESVNESFATALQRWPIDGIPPSPAGWILTTARNRAIDRLRRESSRAQRHREAAEMSMNEPSTEELAVPDERLRLVFTCCHPALALNAR